jgi:hypothetical protein
MKTRYLFMTFLFVSCLVFSQTSGKSLYERLYLQTDKDMYLSGELVWLKLLAGTSEGQPLNFSKIGYIELLDAEISQARLKVELSDGVGNGSLVIPTALPTGYYRLVAYTRYMRNEMPVPLFEKVIGIINPFVQQENLLSSGELTNMQPAQKVQNTISVSNLNSYHTRNLVELKLDQLPENVHSLSVSVAAKDFTSVFPSENIVHWRQETQNQQLPPLSDKYLAEYEGHIILGKLIDESTGQEAPYDEYIMPYVSFPGENIRLFAGKTAKDGSIQFFTKKINGSKEVVSSLSGNNADKYRVDIESPFILNHKKKEMPILHVKDDREKLLQRSMAVQVLYSYMNDSLNRSESVENLFRYPPDRLYIMDEYTKFATMQEVITEFVTFVRFRTLYGQRYLSTFREDIGYSSGNTLVLLDGIPIFDHEIIFKYSPLNIEKIETYFDRYVYGGKWYDGIIHFITRNKNYPDLKPDLSTRFFSYDGTQRRRIFYSPVYLTDADRSSRLPDFRHTLYWNPDVKIENKSSVSIPFYTSDLKGEYQVVVEGLTEDGKPVYATSSFSVE